MADQLLAAGVGRILALRQGSGVSIAGLEMKLTYKVVVPLLALMASVLVGNNAFGTTLECLPDSIDIKIVESFCYTEGSFTYVARDERVGEDAVAKGVHTNGGEKVFHTYYQWAPVIVYIVAALMFSPYAAWRWYENGQTEELTNNLRNIHMGSEAEDDAADKIGKHWYRNRGKQCATALVYYGCNGLSLVVALFLLYILDEFLGNVFMNYGWEVAKFVALPTMMRDDPLVYRFPRYAICDFYRYSHTGAPQSYQHSCILNGNAVLEKVAVITYFVLCVLCAVNLVYIVGVVCTLAFSGYRRFLLSWDTSPATTKMIDTVMAKDLIVNPTLGDYFRLAQIKANVSPDVYDRILSAVVRYKKAADRGNDGDSAETMV